MANPINSLPISAREFPVSQFEETAQRAETARDAAFVNADVYDDTTAGLAGTSDGDQFQVVDGDEIIRYENDGGAAVEVARYPSADITDALDAEVADRVAGDEYLGNRIDMITQVSVVDNNDNTFIITAPESPLVSTGDYCWRGISLPTFTITL